MVVCACDQFSYIPRFVSISLIFMNLKDTPNNSNASAKYANNMKIRLVKVVHLTFPPLFFPTK